MRDNRLPACVDTCPAGALQAGTVDEITNLASSAANEGYPVFGLSEGWKTSWIYVFPMGFDPETLLKKS